MAGYRGAASKGSKKIGGKTYRLWGWLTSKDKHIGLIEGQLRKDYTSVRILGDKAPFAVWVR
jgi:hypothetical protein